VLLATVIAGCSVPVGSWLTIELTRVLMSDSAARES